MPNRRDRRRKAAIERAARKIAAAAGPKLGTLTLSAAGRPAVIKAAEGEDKPRRFEGTAYTGAPMRPQGWYHPVVVDLDGVEVPKQHRPALHNHDHDRVLGHTDSVKVTRDGIDVAGVFSGHPSHTDEVLHAADRGFEWEMSIGADPVATEELKAGATATVNGREVTGPMTISRKTRLGEVSFVPLGADGDTSVSVKASKGSLAMFEKAALKLARQQGVKAAMRYSDDEIDKMDDKEAKAALKRCMKAEEEPEAEAADDEEEEKEEEDKEKKAEARVAAAIEAATRKGIEAARKAQAAEAERVAEIRARVARYGVGRVEIEADGKKITVDLVSHAVAAGWTPDAAELHALRSARPAAGVGGGPLVYSTSQPELNEAVIEAGILQALRHSYHMDSDEPFTERFEDGTSRPRPKLGHIKAEFDRETKSRYPDQVQQHAHDVWKGRKLTFHEVMDRGFALMDPGASRRRRDWKSKEGIEAAMREWSFREQQQAIQAEGSSTMSISNILANVLNKFSLQGYLFVEQVWRQICGVRPVNDFKPAKSINLLGDVMYKSLGPTGELANFSLGDQAFANIAQPFGRIGTIPWTHVVNDDLSILSTVPQKLGQGAGLAINDFVFSLLAALVSGSVAAAGAAGNPNGVLPSNWNLNADDGNAFFRTSTSLTLAAGKAGTAYNKNKATGGGTALSATSLQTAKAMYDNQVDPNMNPLGFEGVRPVLLIGPSNWQTARNLLQADLIVSGNTNTAGLPNKNAWNNYAELAMSRYLESALYLNNTTAWMLFYNPITIAALEVCFLNGVDTPAVLTAGPDYQFDRPGISVRGTMPFGVNQQSFRAAYYMAGA